MAGKKCAQNSILKNERRQFIRQEVREPVSGNFIILQK
jgi:hypothetical protein